MEKVDFSMIETIEFMQFLLWASKKLTDKSFVIEKFTTFKAVPDWNDPTNIYHHIYDRYNNSSLKSLFIILLINNSFRIYLFFFTSFGIT